MAARFLALSAIVLSLWVAGVPAALAQTEEEVAAARARGVKFLKAQQKSDGSWAFAGHDVGITALCTIALIENGVPLNDAALQKGYEYVKKNSDSLTNTYDLSLVIVLLARLGDRRDRSQIKGFAARLMAGQMDSGGWHYTCPGQKLDAEKFLRDPTTGPKPKEGYGDNSCTQFAVLGLWVASRSGVNVDRTLAKVAQRFVKTQTDDGGWAYVAEDKGVKAPAKNTMTGAGLFCLAVAQANQIRDANKSGKKLEGPAAEGKSLLANPVFAKGLKRTGEFVKDISPDSDRYFLWSVERVGVLLGLEQFGEVDWFQRGADGLLKKQTEGGGWPSGWGDADKLGLSDTCFALLFLRKANLGSDISRLLEGEPEQKFNIVGRKPVARFDSIEEAVAAANSGETVRIDGPGPWKVSHLELSKDVTLQAGFGYSPVLKFEIGKSRLGIKLKPETDPNARDMISVAGGNVTLEGIRLQMDPPKDSKKPIPWRAITLKSGSLRLLNCTVSETTKQGTTGIVMDAPGQLVVRNSLLVGGKAGIEIVANDRQELVFDNSIMFSPAGIVVTIDEKTRQPAILSLAMTNSVFQVKEVLVTPNVKGTIDVSSRLCVYQADTIGSNFLVSASEIKGRSWKGALNLYDLKSWIGAGGKALGTVTDAKSWIKFWGNAETESYKGAAPFASAGLRQIGSFTHEVSPQDWQLEFPPTAEAALVRNRVGINSYLAGTGQPFDQYRDTISYSDWVKGRLDLAAIDSQAGTK
jgi:hypothetical protein